MMMTTKEPQSVFPEAEFQKAIVAVIKGILTETNRRFALLERFGMSLFSSKFRSRQQQFVFWK
jgi:hypothetical protein